MGIVLDLCFFNKLETLFVAQTKVLIFKLVKIRIIKLLSLFGAVNLIWFEHFLSRAVCITSFFRIQDIKNKTNKKILEIL